MAGVNYFEAGDLADAKTQVAAVYPLSIEEQRVLFSELAGHLAKMALFKLNTGLREQEVVNLD